MTIDLYKQIAENTSINFLENLIRFVDMDIANLGKDSLAIKTMKAKMRNISVKTMEEQQLKYFLDLKKRIQDRINELKVG